MHKIKYTSEKKKHISLGFWGLLIYALWLNLQQINKEIHFNLIHFPIALDHAVKINKSVNSDK